MRTIDPHLYADLVRSYFGDTKFWVGGALMPLLFIVAAYRAVPESWLACWAALMLAIAAMRFLLHRAYKRADPPPGEAARWMRWGLLGTIASGIVWGLASAIFLLPDTQYLHWLLGLTLVGLISGASVSAAASGYAFYAYAVTALTPYLAGLFAQTDTSAHVAGGIVLAFTAARALTARHYRRKLEETFQLRYANLELIEALRVEKEQADQARMQAEEANAAKSRYLAAASHDLRQPVHALGLFVEELRERTRDTVIPPVLVGNIHSAVESVNTLLGAVLDISKLDSGLVKPAMTSFRVANLLDRAVAQHCAAATAKGLDFRYVSCSATARSDPALLLRVVGNLVANAVRYTTRGRILLGCRRLYAGVRIEIWDTGPGIPLDAQRAIFREFHRLDVHGHDGGKGLGLGLAIAERTARLLQHNLALRSTPGHGAVFWIEVPYGEASAEPSDPALRATPIDLSGLTVAIVDDEQAIIAGMSGLLRRWGCRVLCARSGEELLDELRHRNVKPDVLIVDYQLAHGERGHEVLERVRRQLGVRVPGLLITGDLLLESSPGDAAEILHKPVQPERLRQHLGALAAASGSRR